MLRTIGLNVSVGQKATPAGDYTKSGPSSITDILGAHRHVCFGPTTDMIATAATVVVAAAVGLSGHFAGGVQHVAWKPLALVALAIFPAITTAFNGIRADADLVQPVERSALATVALTRLRRALKQSALNYDRVAAAATRVSLLMGDELSEWRFMLENRRLRQSRRPEWRRR